MTDIYASSSDRVADGIAYKTNSASTVTNMKGGENTVAVADVHRPVYRAVLAGTDAHGRSTRLVLAYRTVDDEGPGAHPKWVLCLESAFRKEGSAAADDLRGPIKRFLHVEDAAACPTHIKRA